MNQVEARSEVRLVAMTDGQVRRLCQIEATLTEQYLKRNDLSDYERREAEADAELARSLADSYSEGITEEEARKSADWIRGHRPSKDEYMRTGRSLDHAVTKLRTAFTEEAGR